MKTRIIAVLSALTLLFAPVYPTFAAVFKDVEGSTYEEAVDLLYSLGILQGHTSSAFGPDEKLTKAEMAGIIARIMGLDKLTVGENIFSDVLPGHSAYNAITVLYRFGIVSGGDGGSFNPDAFITYNQAVKMLICLLGYEAEASSMGGYPAGYIVKATQLGLLRMAPPSGEEELSRGTLAMLLRNAIDIELLAQNYYDDYRYRDNDEDATILSEYLQIYKYEGIITSNYYTTIDGTRSRARDTVRMDDEEFKVGDSKADRLVGMDVIVYAKVVPTDSEPEIKAALKKPKTKVTVVDLEDIAPKTNEENLVYYDDGGRNRERSVPIKTDGAKLVYNGSPIDNWTATDLMRGYGTVTLLQNDGRSADVIFVEDYENFVVTGKSIEDKIIFLKDAEPLQIESDNLSVRTMLLNKDQSPAGIELFAKQDVLSVAVSRDGNVIKLVRCSDVAQGKVLEVDDEGVDIDDKRYKPAKGFTIKTKPENEQDTDEIIKVGATVIYLLDFRGRIVSSASDLPKESRYGYLVAAAVESGVSGEPSLKVFTEDGKMEIFKTSDKVILCGISVQKSDLLPTTPGRDNELFENGKAVRRLIKYRTNNEGKITRIDLEGDGLDDIKKDMYINDRRYIGLPDGVSGASSDVALFVGGQARMFAGKHLIREKTISFVIPDEGAPDEDYFIQNNDLLTHDDSSLNRITLFDTDEDNVVAVLVWQAGDHKTYLSRKSPSYSVTGAIITNIVKGIDDDGETMTLLKIFDWHSNQKTIKVKQDFECRFNVANTNLQTEPETTTTGDRKDFVSISCLNPGDIIQYTTDINDWATMINVVFRAQTPGNYEMSTNLGIIQTQLTENRNYRGGLLSANGIVKHVGQYGVLVEVNQYDNTTGGITGAKFERVFALRGVYLAYNIQRKILTVIKPENIQVGDNIVSLVSASNQRMMVLYN